MADKGFNVQDYLALHETVLIAPPIMRKNNVSARASTATRRVATARQGRSYLYAWTHVRP